MDEHLDISGLPAELLQQLSKPEKIKLGLIPRDTAIVMQDCPFCYRKNWSVIQRPDTKAFQVECRSCWARGPAGVDRPEAMDGWNRSALSAGDGQL